jgi:hypothetical protein
VRPTGLACGVARRARCIECGVSPFEESNHLSREIRGGCAEIDDLVVFDDTDSGGPIIGKCDELHFNMLQS